VEIRRRPPPSLVSRDDRWVMPSWSMQSYYDVRFERGPAGVEAVGHGAVVIVDVLRFTTAVEAAVGRGALVYPYRWADDSAGAFAEAVNAHLGDGAAPGSLSLSPLSLTRLSGGEAVVLPSPNGSTCSAIAADRGATVVAGCLRNAAAVARWLRATRTEVSVIACGERWPDGSLRPALEDDLGAGAVLAHLGGDHSPEAQAVVAAWLDAADRIESVLHSCASGKELVEKGRGDDVAYAGRMNVSDVVPVLIEGAFQALPPPQS
jgi:2-phosphosulfolactate phosphatase